MKTDETNKKGKPWVSTIRRESGLIEHIDSNGVGHPAYGSVHWMKINGFDSMGIHGCNGSCQDKDWQIASLTEGIEIANKIIKQNLVETRKLIAASQTLYHIEELFKKGATKKEIENAVKVYTQHQLGPHGRCPDCKMLVNIGNWHHDHIEKCTKCGREREK